MRAVSCAIVCAVLTLAACGRSGSTSASAGNSSNSSSPSPSGSLAPKLMQPDHVVSLEAGDAPQNPYAAFGALWIAAHHSGTVIRLDLLTGGHVVRIATGTAPGGITAGAGRVWATHYTPDGKLLVGINPVTNRVALKVSLPGESCCQPAVLGSMVWVTAADGSNARIAGVNATSGRITMLIAHVDNPVVVQNQLWAWQDGAPRMVDPTSGAITAPTTPGLLLPATGPAQGLSWTWSEGTAVGIDATHTARRTMKAQDGGPLGADDGSVVTSGQTVWATNGESILWRIDAASSTAVDTYESGDAGTLTIAGDGRGGVWLCESDRDRVLHFAGPS